ncbi:acyl transferase domain-containing protein/acyl carrier protein [Streptomyces canus]|uniref:Acyl transferase domain-containing protein/acyl carrier protein n=1 Tax=Streptomyces canus TaxID=58343 RepID=A0AAW8FQQ3_9ACTN|nr:SDR family NAD(P)-dependent oxidoreductase [Streptomyces canus]MDQ0912426.1 acyl transferase domain-containing protein/acyl carrier protein [Streptomyces canus]
MNRDQAAVPHALVLSASDPAGLKASARLLREHLVEAAARDGHRELSLADVAYTLQTGRAELEHRLAITVTELTDVDEALDAYLAGRSHPALATGTSDDGGGGVSGAVSASVSAVGTAATTECEVARVWVHGAPVDWRAHWTQPARRVSLPTSTWGDETDDAGRETPLRTTAPNDRGDRNHAVDASAALAWLTRTYAQVSGLSPEQLEPRTPLDRYGLSSFLVSRLNSRLEEELGERDRTLFYAHADLAGVADELARRHPHLRTADRPGDDTRHTTTPAAARGTGRAAEGPHDDGAVAVIGIAGRYPQAPDLDMLWQRLVSGTDCVTALPADRTRDDWPADLAHGGFLDRIDAFDPLLFGITPRDADLMDPQERIFLEVAWEALDDAGYPRSRLRERHSGKVAVYAGAMYNEYPYFGVESTLRGDPLDTGTTLGGIANRVSYHFDLNGPSLTVDTMCSSSLVAIGLAIRALRSGEVEAALAGGVNLSVHPNKFRQQQRMRLTAQGRRCRSFGADGDGFVPAEGAGVVLLKPLRTALTDGDRVHAVLRGSATVHAGRTNGFLVPNPRAQAAMVAAALRDASVPAHTIGYIEAHGAGTSLGDPVEIAGLGEVFDGRGLAPGTIPIGSVKSNLGHVEPAAGIAGLTKVILQMRHGRFAPSLHAEELNPGIDWDSVPFRVQRTAADWPAGEHPRRAGISSFGAGGTLAHLIVEEAPPAAPREQSAATAAGPLLFPLSAYDERSLRAVTGRLAAALGERDGHSAADLVDLAYTLHVGREPLRERLAVVATDLAGLRERLERFADGGPEAVRDDPHAFHGRTRGGLASSSPASNDTAALARHWVDGGRVTWTDVRPDDTPYAPRLVSLPSYPFARMRCWPPQLDAANATATTATAAAPVVADTRVAEPLRDDIPLYTRGWRSVGALPTVSGAPDEVLLCLFSDASQPVARALAQRLSGRRVLLVREGSELRDGVPGYVDEAGAQDIVRGFLDDHTGPVGLLDLADLHRSPAECGLWRARLAVLRTLVRERAVAGLRVLQVTSGLQSVDGPSTNPAGARTAAFVRVIGAEYRRLLASVLDTDTGTGHEEDLVTQILAEWSAKEVVGEVCHRAGARFLPELRPVRAPWQPLRTDPDAAYVITGGTRGIGARVARLLAERGARTLVLCGTPRPGGAADDDPVATESASTVSELRERGVDVRVHRAPLTDRQALGAMLAELRGTVSRIGGIVHCAGRPARATDGFAHLDLEEAREVLAPKADGLEALLATLADSADQGDDPDFLLLFSSVCSAVPSLAAGCTDYAAANGLLDFAAASRSGTDRPRVISVDWPQWAQSGGTRHLPNPCAPVGIGPLTDAEGLRVLERALALPSGSRILPAAPQEGAPPPDPDRLVLLRRDATVAMPESPEPSEPPESLMVPPRWLIDIFADTLRIPADGLDTSTSFGDLGVESIMLGELLRMIEDRIERPLHPAALLEHPTLDALAAHLGVLRAEPPDHAAPPEERTPSDRPPSRQERTPDNRIAVIGLATRFPGAPDVDSFWAGLLAGRDAVTEVPASRWDVRRWYRPERAPARSMSKWGGFVEGIEDFDPAYFGFGDEEATCLDPAIRLFLEGSAACLREAGYDDGELAGQDVGVFVGARMSDYGARAGTWSGALRSDQNFIAAHVAHHFDFRGPNLVVDSACSSSLVSVQLAVRSLLAGESRLALAGGVEILLDEKPYLELSAARALSPSGRCATFDERADGFVPAEGCGVVLLKPLAAALADGDRVHAVIEAVAVNNDGRTMGVTTPSPEAQARVVRRALEDAGRRPEEIGMVEAHGTGTLIGDPIELRSLTDVFAGVRPGSCAIGSVKTNLGHLLSAAGIAGLAKTVLALEHGLIPATLSCERPNPRFDFSASPFFPNTRLSPWPSGAAERVAGLSSFGLGGTNAHLIAAALDPAEREGRPVRRSPLPPPRFHRRRLWLEPRRQERTAPAPAPSSFLDLELTVDGRDIAPAHRSKAV